MDSKKKLSEAIKNNDLEKVKYLLERGANLRADDDFALRWAAVNGQLELVKYLLEQGADLHVWKDWALRKAAENGHLEVVKYLLEQGANLHAEDDRALQLAAANGQLEVVKCLLEQGANLHAQNDCALRWAAWSGRLEVVKYLLEQGADSDLIIEEMLVNLFISYDLQIAKITPRLASLLLKFDLAKKSYQISTRNKILSTYKKKVLSSLVILMYRLYYRPSGRGFFQAIGSI